LYAAYTAETLNNILFLASREHINFLGAVTWAFEFEDQPYFEGFRTLATNGVDKPVLNAFRMFGLLGRERVTATCSGALPPGEVVHDGVRGQPDINVIATRKPGEVEILIWNYHDDDLPAAAAPVDLVISGLPAKTSRALLDQFRVDSNHRNRLPGSNTNNCSAPDNCSSSIHPPGYRSHRVGHVCTWLCPGRGFLWSGLRGNKLEDLREQLARRLVPIISGPRIARRGCDLNPLP
jgi:hypothetical protein